MSIMYKMFRSDAMTNEAALTFIIHKHDECIVLYTRFSHLSWICSLQKCNSLTLSFAIVLVSFKDVGLYLVFTSRAHGRTSSSSWILQKPSTDVASNGLLPRRTRPNSTGPCTICKFESKRWIFRTAWTTKCSLTAPILRLWHLARGFINQARARHYYSVCRRVPFAFTPCLIQATSLLLLPTVCVHKTSKCPRVLS
jgi:hypothetical protein